MSRNSELQRASLAGHPLGPKMRRREFITLAGCATIGWPLAARTQEPTVLAVGFLNSASADGYAAMAAAFRRGLEEAGYAAGQNVTIEYRWADNQYERLQALAADLVNRRVNVIFANSPSIPAALAATKTIPIIFNTGDDPVRLGFVASLNRPGGNATGVAIFSGELAAKRLELLREFIPGSKTIAVLVNLDFGPSARFRAEVEAAGRALGLATPILSASKPDEIEAAFDSLARARPDAMLIGPGPFLDSHRDLLIAGAARAAIPAAFETRASALAGGLLSYGADVGDAYRQAGVYAGRVLKGEKPAELPVVRVTKLELVINLKTAKALGLDLPAKILAVADEVVE
jgi:putative tryptophan/tyrosine transport system substrate-binding protein